MNQVSAERRKGTFGTDDDQIRLALRQESLSDDEIAAVLTSRSAQGAAERVVAKRLGLHLGTIKAAVSAAKRDLKHGPR